MPMLPRERLVASLDPLRGVPFGCKTRDVVQGADLSDWPLRPFLSRWTHVTPLPRLPGCALHPLRTLQIDRWIDREIMRGESAKRMNVATSYAGTQGKISSELCASRGFSPRCQGTAVLRCDVSAATMTGR